MIQPAAGAPVLPEPAVTDANPVAGDAAGGAARGGPARLGRKRDPTRDTAILDAALDVLAEVGYAAMTMDGVAARARAGKATVYRRWASKADLVLDAVARMKRAQVDLDRLPDTGTLRGDLLALFKPQSLAEGERKLRVMAGLTSMLAHDQGLAEAANAALVEPWADAHRLLMHRAVRRGEVPADADVETLAQVIPSLAAYRALMRRLPFDRAFLVGLVDGVLLPALRGSHGPAESGALRPAADDHGRTTTDGRPRTGAGASPADRCTTPAPPPRVPSSSTGSRRPRARCPGLPCGGTPARPATARDAAPWP